jgi:putative membrane protein
MLLFLLLSPIMSLFASLTLVSILDNVGKKTLGISSMLLFKAFLLNWTADLNTPFEEFLEKLGENRDVEVCLIQFSSSKPKAVIVVPSIHPGPFKNVGSSLLPSMLKAALEKRLGCVVCVPHGLFGHEFDLSSQTQSQKVIDRVVELANLEVSESRATPFVKVTDGLATACCQVFGNLAFVSFTLSPKTTEDLPQELGSFVRNESERHALKHSVVVDAHNSIDGTADTQKALEALEKVTVSCLEKVASMKPSIFEVGAATLIPKEFDIKQGMGPGGITTVIVKAGKQKTAYVVIDGNNMVSGLRENILSCLHSLQFDEGEVFTTDTHSVNAVILGNRGYHPVGEVMSHETLIGHIKSAVLAALSNLEPVKVAYSSVVVPSVKVIGGKQLERLCLLIDRTLEKAKKVIVPILALSSLPLMLVLTQM